MVALRGEPPTGKPSATGCVLALAAVAASVAAAALFLVFLESGADSGQVVLLDQRAYAQGTVTYVPDQGFFLVRLAGGFVALADLDAANGAAAGRRCRVHTIEGGTTVADDLLARFASRASSPARGAVLLLGEDCNGAVYDVAGVRLDRDGPNLDRFAVTVNERGRVVVSPQERSCTARAGSDVSVPRRC